MAKPADTAKVISVSLAVEAARLLTDASTALLDSCAREIERCKCNRRKDPEAVLCARCQGVAYVITEHKNRVQAVDRKLTELRAAMEEKRSDENRH